MSSRDAETHSGRPFDATENSEESGPGRELATVPEEPEPLEIVEAELVDLEPEGIAPGHEPARAASAPVSDGYTPDGAPTLDYIRQRIATSLGAKEIFDQSAPGADEKARQEALRQATAEKLASLREDLARERAPDQD